MRIYTLGTSHGDSCFNRFCSSTLYEAKDGTLYLIDAGEPVEALIRRKGLNIAHVRATFISHMHDDHTGGLTGLLRQVIKYGALRNQPFTLFMAEEKTIEPFKSWLSSVRIKANYEKVEYKGVDDGKIYEDDNLTVTAIRTAHLCTIDDYVGDPCSFAYILYFKKENLKILHTGDLRSDLQDYPKIAYETDFDACICEATHFKPEEAVDNFKKSRFKKLIFNHICEKWNIRVGNAWSVENGEKKLLEYYKDVPYPVYIAHDGDEFLF